MCFKTNVCQTQGLRIIAFQTACFFASVFSKVHVHQAPCVSNSRCFKLHVFPTPSTPCVSKLNVVEFNVFGTQCLPKPMCWEPNVFRNGESQFVLNSTFCKFNVFQNQCVSNTMCFKPNQFTAQGVSNSMCFKFDVCTMNLFVDSMFSRLSVFQTHGSPKPNFPQLCIFEFKVFRTRCVNAKCFNFKECVSNIMCFQRNAFQIHASHRLIFFKSVFLRPDVSKLPPPLASFLQPPLPAARGVLNSLWLELGLFSMSFEVCVCASAGARFSPAGGVARAGGEWGRSCNDTAPESDVIMMLFGAPQEGVLVNCGDFCRGAGVSLTLQARHAQKKRFVVKKASFCPKSPLWDSNPRPPAY